MPRGPLPIDGGALCLLTAEPWAVMGTARCVVPAPARAIVDAVSREERFEALAHEVVEPVRRFLRRRTDADTAEDALAETLLVCWRRLEEVPEPALPWVYGVARLALANAEIGRAHV